MTGKRWLARLRAKPRSRPEIIARLRRRVSAKIRQKGPSGARKLAERFAAEGSGPPVGGWRLVAKSRRTRPAAARATTQKARKT